MLVMLNQRRIILKKNEATKKNEIKKKDDKEKLNKKIEQSNLK